MPRSSTRKEARCKLHLHAVSKLEREGQEFSTELKTANALCQGLVATEGAKPLGETHKFVGRIEHPAASAPAESSKFADDGRVGEKGNTVWMRNG